MASASVDDTVTVLPGEHRERVTLNRSLTLRAQVPGTVAVIAVGPDGMVVQEGARISFEGLEISNPMGRGLTVVGQSVASVSNCLISDCGGDGIRVAGGSELHLASVQSLKNRGCGVHVEGGSTARIEDSILRGNDGPNVAAHGAERVELRDVEMSDSAAAGLVCVESTIAAQSCRIERNAFSGADLRASSFTMARGSLSGNAHAGLRSTADSTAKLDSVSIKGNGTTGVEADSGAVGLLECDVESEAPTGAIARGTANLSAESSAFSGRCDRALIAMDKAILRVDGGEIAGALIGVELQGTARGSLSEVGCRVTRVGVSVHETARFVAVGCQFTAAVGQRPIHAVECTPDSTLTVQASSIHGRFQVGFYGQGEASLSDVEIVGCDVGVLLASGGRLSAKGMRLRCGPGSLVGLAVAEDANCAMEDAVVTGGINGIEVLGAQCLFSGVRVSGAKHSGIYVEAGDVSMTDCSLTDSTDGRGVHVMPSAALTLRGGSIARNRWGIVLEGGTVKAHQVLVHENHEYGVGLLVGSTATLTSLQVQDGTTGVVVDSGARCEISASVLSGFTGSALHAAGGRVRTLATEVRNSMIGLHVTRGGRLQASGGRVAGCNWGAASQTTASSLELTESVIEDCDVALSVEESSRARVSGSRLRGRDVSQNVVLVLSGSCDISGSTIAHAQENVLNVCGGHLQISGSEVSDSARFHGICVHQGASAEVRDCRISDCSSGYFVATGARLVQGREVKIARCRQAKTIVQPGAMLHIDKPPRLFR